MPYRNEHSCRLHPPEGYQPGTFRRMRRAKLVILIARPRGQSTTAAQSYRYPISEWTEEEARAHCEEAGGEFHPALSE